MKKILIKLFTGILAVLTCNISNATEIKLNCTYSTKISFSTGSERNESGSGIITITDQPWALLIQISPADGYINNFL